MKPLSLDEIKALPVGARVWWFSLSRQKVSAEKVGPDTWSFEGVRFPLVDADLNDGATYLDIDHAPGDSAGMREPRAEAEDVDRWIEMSDARRLRHRDIDAVDFDEPAALDSDGTPDPIPTPDTDPFTEVTK